MRPLPPLPFTAQLILFTLWMMLEPALLIFLVFAISTQLGQPINVSSVVSAMVLGAPAILYPLWLRSRKLTVTPEGVVYTACSPSCHAIHIPRRAAKRLAVSVIPPAPTPDGHHTRRQGRRPAGRH